MLPGEQQSLAVVDLQLHVGEHLRFQVEIRVWKLDAYFHRMGDGINSRINVGDFPGVSPSGVVAELHFRRLAHPHKRHLVLVHICIHPDRGQIADHIQIHIRGDGGLGKRLAVGHEATDG